MVPLSTALADLTAIDGGPLHSHAHNVPHKHTKYNIDKSSKDKYGGAIHTWDVAGTELLHV